MNESGVLDALITARSWCRKERVRSSNGICAGQFGRDSRRDDGSRNQSCYSIRRCESGCFWRGSRNRCDCDRRGRFRCGMEFCGCLTRRGTNQGGLNGGRHSIGQLCGDDRTRQGSNTSVGFTLSSGNGLLRGDYGDGVQGLRVPLSRSLTRRRSDRHDQRGCCLSHCSLSSCYKCSFSNANDARRRSRDNRNGHGHCLSSSRHGECWCSRCDCIGLFCAHDSRRL